MIPQTLIRYIETEIIPRYEHFDKAHNLSHVQAVIDESLLQWFGKAEIKIMREAVEEQLSEALVSRLKKYRTTERAANHHGG